MERPRAVRNGAALRPKRVWVAIACMRLGQACAIVRPRRLAESSGVAETSMQTLEAAEGFVSSM
eukprot:3705691-Pleurochrysis_carterae.AAC.1